MPRSPAWANVSSCCGAPARTNPRSSPPAGRCRTSRGPMTRDQIASLTPPATASHTQAPPPVLAAAATAPRPTAFGGPTRRGAFRSQPGRARGGRRGRRAVCRCGGTMARRCRWRRSRHGARRSDRARVAIRYDEAKADLVHDEEFEAVLFPLVDPVDVSTMTHVDYDDHDLRTDVPAGVTYRLTEARIATKTFFNDVERDLRDHLTRSLSLEIPTNAELKLFGRPGETVEEFEVRCVQGADDRADAEIARSATSTRPRRSSCATRSMPPKTAPPCSPRRRRERRPRSSSRRRVRCSADCSGAASRRPR